MRFLHYKEGGYLAPHTDLCRCDWKTDKRTTHTFILYLRDPTRTDADNADTGGAGGETVLMHTLKGQDLVKVRNSESWTVERRSGCIMSLCPSIWQIEAPRVEVLDNINMRSLQNEEDSWCFLTYVHTRYRRRVGKESDEI